MKDAGLYDRHSTSEPMLKGFALHLKQSLLVTHYKQEVEDVARFLYYMNPKQASLDFVKDIEKANSFFNKLREINLANQTVFNYLKHVRRFMTYHVKSTNLFQDNPLLYNSCKFFLEFTEDIQKRLSRGISREVVGKRYVMSSPIFKGKCFQKFSKYCKLNYLKLLCSYKSDWPLCGCEHESFSRLRFS